MPRKDDRAETPRKLPGSMHNGDFVHKAVREYENKTSTTPSPWKFCGSQRVWYHWKALLEGSLTSYNVGLWDQQGGSETPPKEDTSRNEGLCVCKLWGCVQPKTKLGQPKKKSRVSQLITPEVFGLERKSLYLWVGSVVLHPNINLD